ncbi:hypothetical protein C2G38_2098347 [Gigaspora rosea]|uniref:MD-2-related lipid-recognition domain-containing protein n=1 Tax=Gigaspora rosea TaxID=44941 RepID=A0A397UVM2_9GLOM|nr:hypothetical protein C2G38_2098347 [Gigaspora rosea]
MKNFIFASILFVLLLTVNAVPHQLNKRAITFGPCPTKGTGSIDPLNVTIGSDTPKPGTSESFSISGTLTKKNIVQNITLLEIAYKDKHGQLIADPYNQTFTDSINAGNDFNASLAVFPTPELPDSYNLEVMVGDPLNGTTRLNIFACALATVG